MKELFEQLIEFIVGAYENQENIYHTVQNSKLTHAQHAKSKTVGSEPPHHALNELKDTLESIIIILTNLNVIIETLPGNFNKIALNDMITLTTDVRFY